MGHCRDMVPSRAMSGLGDNLGLGPDGRSLVIDARLVPDPADVQWVASLRWPDPDPASRRWVAVGPWLDPIMGSPPWGLASYGRLSFLGPPGEAVRELPARHHGGWLSP